MKWMQLAQDRAQSGASLNMVMNVGIVLICNVFLNELSDY
jgi:hypothetical protein